MLLCSSSGIRRPALGHGCAEDLEDLAGDVALDAAENLALREALRGSAFRVLSRAGVAAEPYEGNNPERAVRITVASAVESVAVLSAGGGIDG
jgi:hypothetical protein